VSKGPPTTEAVPPFHPFPNFTQYALSHHFLNTFSGQHSGADFDQLMNVISDTRFVPADIKNFRVQHMQQLLDGMDLCLGDGWKRDVDVIIHVPEGKKWLSSPQGRPVKEPGLCHRRLREIMRKVYSTATNLHFTPFELFHQTPDGSVARVWGDLYSSPAFLEAHKRLLKVAGCTAESAIAPLMFWSDSTHLTSFGTSKLWPIYMFLGSQDKHLRVKPRANVCHHVAYIPSVSHHAFILCSSLMPMGIDSYQCYTGLCTDIHQWHSCTASPPHTLPARTYAGHMGAIAG
jgi:Plavaka transposase